MDPDNKFRDDKYLTKLLHVRGWSLVRYIEKRFGRERLRKIMVESCTEDILSFLKLHKKGFELEWRRAMPGLAKEAIGHKFPG